MMELFEEIYKRRKNVFACIQGKLFRNNICFLPQSIFRSSRSQLFFSFANFSRNRLCWSLFLKKLQTCNFIKKRFQRRCFSLRFSKYLRAAFFYRTSLVAAFAFHATGLILETVVQKCSVPLRPAALLKKETLAQVLSCEFCKISKNTFSYRTPPVDASFDLNPQKTLEKLL